MPITKAVFPVAGLGTRFLPATKASPKEMLPIVDRPLIQYAVEEAVAAGITELIFVTSGTKRAIEDHFDSNFELEQKLLQQEKFELLDLVRQILPSGVSCLYIRQPEPLGLGHAIACARPALSDAEAFAVLLADDLIDTSAGMQPCLAQLIGHYETMKHQSRTGSVLAVEVIDWDQTERYGIIQPETQVGPEQTLSALAGIVEKPIREAAPSNLGVVGRYILTRGLLDVLLHLNPGKHGEYQLTDAIAQILSREPVYAALFQGQRYDCGDKLDYLKAIVSFGLKNRELGVGFKEYLAGLRLV